MYSSLHGPHGPVGPACQKFSSRSHSTIRSRGTPIDSHASIASWSGPRPSSSSPSKTVIQMLLGVDAEALGGELPGELRGALLEVVAHREVAEHLEERQVPVRGADVVDVRRAEHLLAGHEPVMGRLLEAEEVRLQRLHPGDRQQRRRVARRRHERRRGQPAVVVGLEELLEGAANLVRLHGTMQSRCSHPA